MKRALESVAIVALLSISLTSATRARDHGVVGQVFPIVEPDLLATIEAKLQRLQAEGEIDRMNAAFAKRTEARVRRPKPVAGITPASEARTWAYDPTITIERDVQDPKGNYIARRGQTVNPLDFTAVSQALVFVDGDNDAEMAWATTTYSDLKAKIILVSGSPIDEMTQRQRRFYFDQEGRLTGKLGIRHTPAVAVQDGRVMKLSEIKLKGNS
ncbi:type-F conjugative transfer system protein TraW [Sphingomonas sp. BK069]|uniref:type-F conjugative transfer system protein TraW n=1 Tax=Sphingomonas sp. BK069 TaxID=2586979 RepID=UPI00161C5A7B|nr:type-F conjugative transfer system protein TraW [Sphingomonas sp. BK069]MBB3350020.1 conjugal transfer pilus assembly protein TraW [Sphingomonas sp. BK069]